MWKVAGCTARPRHRKLLLRSGRTPPRTGRICGYNAGMNTATFEVIQPEFGPLMVGTGQLEMLWTGDFVDADEALALGIVSKVCDDETLVEEMHALAARLASGPRVGIRLIKQVMRQSQNTDLIGALDLVTGPLGVATATDDAAEAINAFLEKRAPRFTGQ